MRTCIIYKRHLQVFGVSLVVYGGSAPPKKHKQNLARARLKSHKKVTKLYKKVQKTYCIFCIIMLLLNHGGSDKKFNNRRPQKWQP